MSQAFCVSASSQIEASFRSARLGVKRKARPSLAPGRVIARTARTSTRTIRLGIRNRAAVSIPFTPLETTKTPMLIATTCVTRAWGEPAKPSQNAPGTSAGMSPVTAATKKRIVQPITTE